MITSMRSSLLFSGNCLRKQSSRNISSTDLLGESSHGGQALELNPAPLGEGERPSNQPGATYTGFQRRHPSLYGLPPQGSPLREIASPSAALQESPQSIANQTLGQRIWNFLKMFTTQTLPTNLGALRQEGRVDIERGEHSLENDGFADESGLESVDLGEITLNNNEPLANHSTIPTARRLGDEGPLGTTSTEHQYRLDAMAFSP